MQELSLDVHVLYLPTSKVEYLQRCVESLERAIGKADYPINIHLVEGVHNHLGQSRKLGYSKGTAPYVTHVDFDDEVTEDAFVEIKPFLNGMTGVTTGERVNHTTTGHTLDTPNARHHLAVFLRQDVEKLPYHKLALIPDQFIIQNIKTEHLAKCLYIYNVYPDSHSRQQAQVMIQELKEEKALIRNPKLLQCEALDGKSLEEFYNLALD